MVKMKDFIENFINRRKFLLSLSLLFLVLNTILLVINLSFRISKTNIKNGSNYVSDAIGSRELQSYHTELVGSEAGSSDKHRTWSFRYNTTYSLVKGVWLSMDFKDFYLPLDDTSVSDPLINKHQYQIILNSDKCKDNDVFLIVFVHSAIDAFKKRQLIRSTYGSVKRFRNRRLEYVFVVGQVANDTKHAELKNESLVYNDIIQGNFNDAYFYLTYKQIFGYFWVSKFCAGASFVLKLDDDILMNPKFIIEYLLLISEKKKIEDFLFCRYLIRQVDLRPIRYGGKWKQGKDEYPYDTLPPYCVGWALLMSNDVVNIILETSKVVPFNRIDDVYIGFTTWVAKITLFEPNFFLSNIKWRESRTGNLSCTMFYSVQNFDGSYPFEVWKNTWNSVNNSKYCQQKPAERSRFLTSVKIV